MSEYAVIYERADDGAWSAYVPDVPGVVASADSRAEVEIAIREALELHNEELVSRGRGRPEPRVETGVISV